MTSMELLELLGNVKDSYVADAQTPVQKVRSFRRPLLVAAIVALMLLLVGCTVAYVNGWFTDFFEARSEEPLSNSQIDFIESNTQAVEQAVASQGWQVELQSTLSDGDTGYVLFHITAPVDVDLEGINANEDFWNRIVPGNDAATHPQRRTLVVPSCGNVDAEKNFIWQNGGHWRQTTMGKPTP